jgi:hypothetical protein
MESVVENVARSHNDDIDERPGEDRMWLIAYLINPPASGCTIMWVGTLVRRVRRWNLTEAQVEQMDVRKVRVERT